MENLISKYGGKKKFKLYYAIGLVKEYLPKYKPELRHTKNNRPYIKEGKCKEEITLDDLENICFKSVNNSIESNITEETVINSLAYHRTVEEIEELEAKLQAMTLRKELLNTFIKEKEDDEMKSKRIAEMKAKK